MCKGEYRVGQNPGGNVVVVSDSLWVLVQSIS